MSDRTDGAVRSAHDTAPVPEFARPGEYAYRVRVRGRGEGRVAWCVTGSAPERTVAVRYEVGTEPFETTLTGGPGAVRDALLSTPAAAFVMVLGFPSVGALAQVEDLPVGRQVPLPGPDTNCVEVAEVTQRAGLDCYHTVWREDGTVRYEDRIAPETGPTFAATYYTADDPDPFLHAELVEHPTE